ncbi:MAG: DMT family transporter [Candidatus Micrarchaeota archaeon]|nr:DMT family transporter [Candidatus Micrarchaeota archaeon]
MQISTKAYIYLFASLLIGSFTPVLLVLTIGTNAFELFLLASLFSIPVGLALLVKKNKLPALAGLLGNKKRLFYIALAALLSYVPYQYGIAYAEHFISASLATVLFRLNPLLMLIFIPFLLNERLSKSQMAALGLAFTGIIIGVSGGNLSGILGSANLPIIGFVIMLAVGYALSNIIIKREMIDTELYLAGSAFALTLFYAIFFVGSGAHFVALSALDIGIIAYLAITNIFGFYMYVHALKVLKTTIVTNTYLLSPFFTFVWADVLFGTPIKIYYLAIAVLAGIGIVIQRQDKVGGSYRSSKRGAPKHNFTIFDVTGAFGGDGQGTVKDIVRSGGRVFATKVHKDHAHHIAAMIDDSRFANAYSGSEGFISNESAFVREILGVQKDEAMVIKAGAVPENDAFFDELNQRIGPLE